jgi:chemotaxis response regulator CheB
MAEQKIILANIPRLMRDMLNRILFKADNLEVVQEVADYQNLPSAIEQFDADWVLMELPDVEQMPEWVDTYIDIYPSVHFMAISTDSSRVTMKWLENREEKFTDLTLPDLIHILES